LGSRHAPRRGAAPAAALLVLTQLAACSRLGPEQLLGTQDRLTLGGRPRSIVLAGGGEAPLVAFVEQEASGDTDVLVLAASADAGRSFSAAVPVAAGDDARRAAEPVLFVGPDGEATIVWRALASGRRSLRAVRHAPAGTSARAPDDAPDQAIELAADTTAPPRGGGTIPTVVAGTGAISGSPVHPEVNLEVWQWAPQRRAWARLPGLAQRARALGYHVWAGEPAPGRDPLTIMAAIDPSGRLAITALAMGEAQKSREPPELPDTSLRPRSTVLDALPAGPEPPWIGAAAGRAVVAWSEQSGGLEAKARAAVKLTSSADAGVSWSAPLAIMASETGMPPLARFATGDGSIAAVWCQRDEREGAARESGPSRIMLAVSSDGGRSFAGSAAVDSGLPGRLRLSPDVALAAGRVLIAWQEQALGAGGRPEVHAALSLDRGRSWAIADTRIDDPGALREAWFPATWLAPDGRGLVAWESRAPRQAVFHSPADVDKRLPASVLARWLR